MVSKRVIVPAIVGLLFAFLAAAIGFSVPLAVGTLESKVFSIAFITSMSSWEILALMFLHKKGEKILWIVGLVSSVLAAAMFLPLDLLPVGPRIFVLLAALVVALGSWGILAVKFINLINSRVRRGNRLRMRWEFTIGLGTVAGIIVATMVVLKTFPGGISVYWGISPELGPYFIWSLALPPLLYLPLWALNLGMTSNAWRKVRIKAMFIVLIAYWLSGSIYASVMGFAFFFSSPLIIYAPPLGPAILILNPVVNLPVSLVLPPFLIPALIVVYCLTKEIKSLPVRLTLSAMLILFMFTAAIASWGAVITSPPVT